MEKMTQQLVLAIEDIGFVPNTHVAVYTIYNSSSRTANALFRHQVHK